MNEFRDIRMFYRKGKNAKYISHLDTVRSMERTLKRSKLPVWYTQGFNPKIYITFALPTSLGFKSEYEIMDFRINEEISLQEIKRRLSREMPDGFKIIQVDYPKDKARDITSASYKIKILADEKHQQIYENFRDFITQNEIIVDKKTKKGIKKINLKDQIISMMVKKKENGIDIIAMLDAGDKMLNPNLIMENFKKNCNTKIKCINITKTLVYNKDNKIFK